MVTSKLRKHKTNVALFSSQMIDSSKSLKVSLKPILQTFCSKVFRILLLDLYESKGLYHEQFCLSLSKPGLVSFFSSEPSPWPGLVSALLMGTCGRRQKNNLDMIHLSSVSCPDSWGENGIVCINNELSTSHVMSLEKETWTWVRLQSIGIVKLVTQTEQCISRL